MAGTPSTSTSQEIKINGGLVLPRYVGLGALGSAVMVAATLIAFGVRADTRISALEKTNPAKRLHRIERVLCAMCASDPRAASNPACTSICQE